MSTDRKLNIICWSGGKDSTATVILAHEFKFHIDEIIICLMYFDKSRGIYAEHPKHIKWIFEVAKPLFESWGYTVKIITPERDYMSFFYQVREKSATPEYIGKYYGWLIGGKCKMSGLKKQTIERYVKNLKKSGYETLEFVGIGIDEPERLERLYNQQGKSSLLAYLSKTTSYAFRLCRSYGLLSPTYSVAGRGGCWFCPNQKIPELAALKQENPELFAELEKLDAVKGTIQRCFRYNKTFKQIASEVDEYIMHPPPEQLNIFDFIEEAQE